MRKKILKIIIVFFVLTLMISASSTANSVQIVEKNRSNDHSISDYQRDNPMTKFDTSIKTTILDEDEAENGAEISNDVLQYYTDDPVWHQFYSDEWNFLAKDEEWGKIGKVNQKIFLYKLKYDEVSNYDWYAIVWTIQTLPGHVAFNNDWRVMDIYNWVDGDRYKSYTKIIDHGPYSTQGQTTVTYNIGVEAGTEGAAITTGISVSYTTADINIHDQSDFSKELAKWWHDVNEDTIGWDKVITLKPGVVFRVPQSNDLKLNFTTKVKFCTKFWVLPPDKIFTQTLWWTWSNIKKNYKPDIPSKPSGPSSGDEEKTYEFSTRTVDPDYDQVKYEFSWGDGKTTTTDWFNSDQLAEASHKWSDSDTSDDTYSIKVRAQDKNGEWSEWSDIHSITIKDDDKARIKKRSNELLKTVVFPGILYLLL